MYPKIIVVHELNYNKKYIFRQMQKMCYYEAGPVDMIKETH